MSPLDAPHRPPAPTSPGRVQALPTLRRLLVASALLALAGCAALQPESPGGDAARPPSQLQLTVVAPEDLKRLLETHLDLARLAIVAPGEVLSDAELRRLEAAAPAQARSILATRGHMDAEVKVERDESGRRHIVPVGDSLEIPCELALLAIGFDGVEYIMFLAEHQLTCALIIISGADARLANAASKLASTLKLNLKGLLRKPVDFKQLDAMLAEISASA